MREVSFLSELSFNLTVWLVYSFTNRHALIWNLVKLTLWQGYLKVMDKHSSNNINRTFIQSYQVFNNILKMLAKN